MVEGVWLAVRFQGSGSFLNLFMSPYRLWGYRVLKCNTIVFPVRLSDYMSHLSMLMSLCFGCYLFRFFSF